MVTENPAVQHRKPMEELKIVDKSWLTLGQLRELVRKADELGWVDKSLVSHGTGSDHPYRHDIRNARYIVVEGGPAA